MKNLKEYKISVVMFGVAIALFVTSGIVGLMSGINISIDKICFFLGIAIMSFGFTLLYKAKKLSAKEGQ